MANQLELQESEIAKYEEMVNSLDDELQSTRDQLRIMTEERDSLKEELERYLELDNSINSNKLDQNNFEELTNELENSKTKYNELEVDYEDLSQVSFPIPLLIIMILSLTY